MKLKLLRQIITMSKYALYGLSIQLFLCSFLLAEVGNGQHLKKLDSIYISLSLEDASLDDTFASISEQTDFHFSYKLDKAQIRKEVKISATAKNASLGSVLRGFSREYGLSFKRINENIFVKNNDKYKAAIEEIIDIPPVQFLISGTITSVDEGEPLPGVSILIKGTSKGTTTNIDGKYSLNASSGDVLQFSFIGYETQEVEVSNQSIIDIALKNDLEQLEEVIVIGYGSQKRSVTTGAVSTVEGKALENRPSSSIENLLQGAASGVQVVSGTGQPGSPATIRIRGAGSFSAGNDPLYVIDGVPVISSSQNLAGGQTSPINPLADINPNDIESINILKDAASAAIYGSRASNGVVLITTKRGKEGKAQFNVNFFTGMQRILRQLPTLSPRDQRNLYVDKWVFGRGTLDQTINRIPSDRYRPEAIDTLNPGMGLVGVDWQSEVFDWAPITKTDISVSGGTNKLTYALSGEYFDQDGILLNSKFRRISTRMNAELKATNWLKIGNNFSYANTESNRTREDNLNQTTWYYWYNSPGYTDRIDPVTGLPAQRFPTNVLNEQVQNAYTNRIFGNIYAEAQIIKGLKFRSNYAVDVSSQKENGFYPSTVNDVNGFRYVFDGTLLQSRWINENYFTYTQTFNDAHNLTVLLGSSYQKETLRRNFLSGNGGSNDKITTASGAAVPLRIDAIEESNTLESYYSRVNYSFKEKYLLSASIRTDGSSKFGEDNRYAVFPSATVGWVVSEESFLQGVNWLSEFKLRASYGQTGNQEALGNYTALGIVQSGLNYEGAGTGPTGAGIPNNILKWETSEQIDIGIDFNILQGRFGTSVSWYTKTTEDLLFNRPLPGTSGYSSIISNIGSIRNRGIDIDINAFILTGEFTWNVRGNISFLDNEVLKLTGDSDERIIQGGGNWAAITEVGEKLGNLYGYQYEGVYATDEDVPAGAGVNGRLSTADTDDEFRMGTPIIRDINGDGRITPDDRVVVGNAIADYTGGLTSRMAYKGFEFNVLLTFSVGNDIWHTQRANRDGHSGNFRSATPEAYLNRWQNEGDVTNWPLVTQGRRTQVMQAYRSSTQFLEDGSFLKIRNITFAYNLNQNILSKIGLRSARIYFTGENLRTFTEFTGYDPELVNLNNPLLLGREALTMPTSLGMTVGLNIGF